jgi:cytochrome c oxidase accessory protein FixG
MFDRNSLLIAYDPMRGEPRGPRKRGLGDVIARGRGLLDRALAYDYVFRATRHPTAADNRSQAGGTITFDEREAAPLPKFPPEELGDCIDCTICVQVCPTGIDIRNGLQYECIACGACVDACDEVMAKMGFASGLIRYTTQNALDGQRTQVLRPRILLYGTVLLALLVAFAWFVAHRSPLIAEVLRDRNALYHDTGRGIANGYTLKLANKAEHAQRYQVVLETPERDLVLAPLPPVVVAAGAVAEVPLTVTGPATMHGRHEVHFSVRAVDGSAQSRVDSSFFGPLQ